MNAILHILSWTLAFFVSSSASWPWRPQFYPWHQKKTPHVLHLAERHGETLFSPHFYDTVVRNSQLLTDQSQKSHNLAWRHPGKQQQQQQQQHLTHNVPGNAKPNDRHQIPPRRFQPPHAHPKLDANSANLVDPFVGQQSFKIPVIEAPPHLPLLPKLRTTPSKKSPPAMTSPMAKPSNTATKPTSPKPPPPPPTTPPLRFIDALEFVDENILLYTAMVVTYIILKARGVDVTFQVPFGTPIYGRRSLPEQNNDYKSMRILMSALNLRSNSPNDYCVQRAACKVSGRAVLLAEVLQEFIRLLEYRSDLM